MLHGCRPDLILSCLVYSNKDRNLYLYLKKKIDLFFFNTKIYIQ